MALQLLYRTAKHEYFRDFVDGVEVIFLKNLATSEFTISAESVAQILGFKNLHEMMSNDRILDIMNEYKAETGKEFPIRSV